MVEEDFFFFLDAQKSKKLAGENGPMVLGDDFDVMSDSFESLFWQ